MRHLLTLFFAASCLTALGQDEDVQPNESSVFFDGSGDYVVIPETPGFESENHTIMLWFFSEHVRYGDCISKDSWGGGRQWLFETRDQKTVVFHVWTDAGLAIAETGVALEDNRWYHLAQRWDGQSLDFFIDGVLVASKSHSGQLNSGNSPVRIGGGAITDDQYGHEDEVQIWSRALSASEINGYMMCRPAPGTENLEGLWTFENVVDGVVPDLSGNERHGTIQGNTVASSLVPSLECEDWVAGCTDSNACNYDPTANFDDDSCIPSGCVDDEACNFNPLAECQGEECDYSCCPGPGCCLDGQHWDWELNGCVITNPADINLDGCVQLNDLLDLLSAYGNCGAEESPWQCGDPLEYQDYDYETVQIGEQCWFAENLRALNYRSGNPIPSNLSNSEWIGTIEGAVSTYGEGDIPCDDSSQSVSACDESVALDEFGRLYNYYAVVDSRQLCPQNWRVGNTTDFSELIEFLGGTELAGELMRASSGWNVCAGCSGSGNNESGFNGKPGGGRSEHTGHFGYAGLSGLWWVGSIDNSSSDAFYHGMDGNSGTGIFGFSGNPNGGISIRCIQNAE